MNESKTYHTSPEPLIVVGEKWPYENLGEKELELLVYIILEAQPPSGLETAAHAVTKLFYGGIGDLVGLKIPVKSIAIKESMPILKTMVKKLLVGYPDALVPGLSLISQEQIKKDGLTLVGGGRIQKGTVYALHPLDDGYFLPYCDFHQLLEEEKRSEFQLLLAGLGAKRISYNEFDTESKSGKLDAGIAVPVEGIPVEANAGVSGRRKSDAKFEFTSGFPQTAKEPCVPKEGLRWLKAEPEWQTLVRLRTEYAMTNVDVRFEYSRDYGITGDASLKILDLGFSIGGEFQAAKKYRREYSVEFWDK